MPADEYPQTARRHFLNCRKFWTRGLFRGAPVLALCALVLAAVVAACLPEQWNRWLYVYQYHYLTALNRSTGRLFKLEDGCEPPENYTGAWLTWYKDGTLATEDNYKNGLKNGVCRAWHGNGIINEECEYKNGRTHGALKFWNFSGKLILESKFENGIQVGTQKLYTANGKIKRLIYYKHGKPCKVVFPQDANSHYETYNYGEDYQKTTSYENGQIISAVEEWTLNYYKIATTYNGGKPTIRETTMSNRKNRPKYYPCDYESVTEKRKDDKWIAVKVQPGTDNRPSAAILRDFEEFMKKLPALRPRTEQQKVDGTN